MAPSNRAKDSDCVVCADCAGEYLGAAYNRIGGYPAVEAFPKLLYMDRSVQLQATPTPEPATPHPR